MCPVAVGLVIVLQGEALVLHRMQRMPQKKKQTEQHLYTQPNSQRSEKESPGPEVVQTVVSKHIINTPVVSKTKIFPRSGVEHRNDVHH